MVYFRMAHPYAQTLPMPLEIALSYQSGRVILEQLGDTCDTGSLYNHTDFWRHVMCGLKFTFEDKCMQWDKSKQRKLAIIMWLQWSSKKMHFVQIFLISKCNAYASCSSSSPGGQKCHKKRVKNALTNHKIFLSLSFFNKHMTILIIL